MFYDGRWSKISFYTKSMILQTNILRRQDENGAMCGRAEDGTDLVQVLTFQSLGYAPVHSFSLSKITSSKNLTTSLKVWQL